MGAGQTPDALDKETCDAFRAKFGSRLALSLSLALLLGSSLAAQSATPEGAALAARALAALESGTPVGSVSLSGSAAWTAGAYTDSGTVTLAAAAGGFSRVDLELGGGSRITVHSREQAANGAIPHGAVQASGTLAPSEGGGGGDGAAHALQAGDAFSPAAWFFPALVLSEAAGPGATATDTGPATLSGAAVAHLRLTRTLPQKSARMTAELEKLSQADFDLDPATGLPLALAFVRHPGGIINRTGVHVEIRYSDWRQVSGVQVPYRIERWINGTRQLVIAVDSVSINPSLQSSEFELGGAQ